MRLACSVCFVVIAILATPSLLFLESGTRFQTSIANLAKTKRLSANALAQWSEGQGLSSTDARKSQAPLMLNSTLTQSEPKAEQGAVDPARPANFAQPESQRIGNISAGAVVFFENQTANCSKCHMANGRGGNIGPDLSDIGSKPAEEILQSIVEPSRVITKGFETLVVQTIEGLVVSGIVRENHSEKIVLVNGEGQLVTILQEDIDDQQPGLSAMPAGVAEALSPQELADLLAYLKSLKGNQ